MFGIALAVGITNGLRKPADARREPEQERAYQTLIDNEKMARAIIEEALDAFVQTDGSCVVLNWSPHAEALMGWTHEEAIGRSKRCRGDFHLQLEVIGWRRRREYPRACPNDHIRRRVEIPHRRFARDREGHILAA